MFLSFECFFSYLIKAISLFFLTSCIIDLIFLLFTIWSVIKCYSKGFVLSLLSVSKWILAYVITLLVFPRIKPYFKNIIDSEYVLDITLGLAIFVSLLKWLLENRARVTLVIITGLMCGSLRALWPWQGPERELLAPTDQVGVALLLFVVGAGFVISLLVLERKFGASEEQKDLLKS